MNIQYLPIVTMRKYYIIIVCNMAYYFFFYLTTTICRCLFTLWVSRRNVILNKTLLGNYYSVVIIKRLYLD